ncbi:unnamed protein product, partial [Arabidopsis halleri]
HLFGFSLSDTGDSSRQSEKDKAFDLVSSSSSLLSQFRRYSFVFFFFPLLFLSIQRSILFLLLREKSGVNRRNPP